jgi:hypothetical protein
MNRVRSYPICFALVIVTLIAGPARADEAEVVRPKSTSPYEIARVINRSSAQFDENYAKGISGGADVVDLSRTWKRLGVPPGGFETCPGYCEAKIFLYDLDGERGREVLLKINWGTDLFRYLVFKRASRGRWKFLGFVDHDFNRYQESSHRVLRARGRNWLVIRGQEGSGSGYALYAETWYEVSARGLRPVLYYPVGGGVVPWPSGVSREFKARVVGARGEASSVALSYSVSYSIAGAMGHRYKNRYRNRFHLRYVWNGRRRAFAFDAARSNISEAEIYAVAELEVEPGEGDKIGGSEFFKEGDAWKRGGYDVFLKYNLRSLLTLARGKDDALKEWLSQVLNDCADTRERRVLERALEKHE